MVQPKMFGAVQALTNNAQSTKDYFSAKYSLKAKAGNDGKLSIGQDIYCLPLIKNGVYELHTHAVKPKRPNVGFKSKFTTYIACKGFNEETGRSDGSCICCKLAQEEYDKFLASGKKYETLISFQSSRFFIPVMLLGNDTGSKSAIGIPLTKLTLSGRDFSYIELSSKAFTSLIEQFKNDLINNGRMDYSLEGEDMWNEIFAQFQKHILKISIAKPDSIGTHKKVFSFISYDNKSIGAETNSYVNITEGLARSAKLKTEVEEYLTLFSNEIESVLMPWNEADLEAYVHGTDEANTSTAAQAVASTGVIPKATVAPLPKEEQVVIEDDIKLDGVGEEDEFFDGESEITLDDEPAPVASNPVVDSFSDEDMSFDMEEEDFFGDE